MPRPRSCVAIAAIAVLAVAAALVRGPAGADAATSQPETLAQPISNYLLLDVVRGKDASGRAMLYGSTYVVSNDGVYFVAIDAATGDVVKLIHMQDAWGGYHVTASPDGKVYLAPLSPSGLAKLWMYDPQTDRLGVVAIAPGDDDFFFGVTTTPWGHVYAGGYPSGRLYDYDPDTGSLTNLGVVVPGNRYPKALISLPGKRLLVGSGAPANLTVYDVKTGAKTDVLPARYRGYSFAYNVARVDNDVFVQMVTPDVRLARFDALDMDFLGELPSAPGNWGMGVVKVNDDDFYVAGVVDGEPGYYEQNVATGELSRRTSADWVGKDAWWVDADGQRAVVSVGSTGLYGRWNPKTGELVTKHLALPGAPTDITALQTGPDGKIYGGTYETNALFSWDPATDDLEVLGPVAKNRSGEILAMASTAGKLFIASYTFAVLTVYDPSKPWDPGTGPGSNPRDLGTMGDEQYRPWDATVGDDGRVYVASGAAYGNFGGALTAIDPNTYEMRSWRYLAGDQQLFSLAPGDGTVYVGTTNFGDGVTSGGSAQVLAFDEASESVAWSTVPVPGSNLITALATAPDGTIFGAAIEGEWFTIDPDTHAVTRLGGFPLGQPVLGLGPGPDGRIYGHTANTIFRIDPVTRQVEKIADTAGDTRYRTQAFDASGRLYWGAGPNLMRMTP